MKLLRLTTLIYFCLATLCVAQTDRRDSELQQRYRFGLSDRIRLISPIGGGAYTNYTISGQNLIDSLGGPITNNSAATSNSVTGNITNLLSVTIVTNYLDSDGDSVTFSSAGTFANSTQAKSLFVALGGTILGQTTNIIFTTGNTNSWRIIGEIVRKSSASYIASVTFFPDSLHSYAGAAPTNYTYTATIRGTESFLTNNTLAIQTRGITAGDVTNEYLRVFNVPVIAP